MTMSVDRHQTRQLGETGVVMARVPSFVKIRVTSSARDVERLQKLEG